MMTTSKAPLLSIRKLTRWFGSIAAVRDLDLTVREGDVYGFLGLNGAGKTTTIRATLGLLKPSGGDIELFGRSLPLSRPTNRMGLGALVEAPAFYGRLSGMHNVRALGGFSGSVTRDEARRLLARVGLEAAADRPARTYSLGMKQRLGLALALAASPRMIILDEPTNGLDPQGIREIRDLLIRLNQEEGLTIMVSSHLLSEVEQLCTRVGIIHEGQHVLEDDMEDLMRRAGERIRLVTDPVDRAQELIREAFPEITVENSDGIILLGNCPDLDTGDVVARLVTSGIKVTEIGRVKLSLEEIFLGTLPSGEKSS